MLWPGEAGATDRRLFGPITRLPENVRERLIAVLDEGVLFEGFETITPNQREQLRGWLVQQARGDGWTISSLADALRQIAPQADQYDAERIARTETQAWVTKAREQYYEESFDDAALFIWQGPQDNRTSDACEWLKEQANPRYGGKARTLDELRDLVEDAQDRFFPNLEYREWTVHPHERHTLVRYYDLS